MFPENSILQVCDYLGHKYKKQGSNIMSSCAACGGGKKTPCTSIDPMKNCWKCHSCGAAGGLNEIAQKYNKGLNEILTILNIERLQGNYEQISKKRPAQALTPKMSLDFFSSAELSEESKNIFSARGIDYTKINARELNEGFEYGQLKRCYDENLRIVAPIFTPSGQFSSCKFRRNDGQKGIQNMSKCELFLIGWDGRKNIKDSVIICEGEMDYYTLISEGFKNALAVPSSTYTIKPEEIRELPEQIYFLLDNDASGIACGERNAREIKKLFPSKRVNICILEKEKDVNALLMSVGKVCFWGYIEQSLAYSTPWTGLESARKNINSRINEWKKRAIEAKESGKSRPESIKISCGIPAVDKITNGGLRYGLYGLAGCPGIGKTTICLAMSKAILEGNQDAIVLFFSLEMACEEMENIILSWASGVNYFHMVDNILSLEEIEKIEAAQSSLGFMNRLIVNDSDRTISHIEKTVNNLKGQIGDKKLVVFVDYLQQVQNDKYKEKRDGIGATAYALKDLGLKQKIPIIAISSIGRAQYQSLTKKKDEKPNPLAFFKESGDIEYSLYGAITLTYSENIKNLKTNRNGRVIEMGVRATCCKNRFGGCKDREGNDLFEEFALDFTNGQIRGTTTKNTENKTIFSEEI